jgi:hypothetical protein
MFASFTSELLLMIFSKHFFDTAKKIKHTKG